MEANLDRISWRLLPSERVLWQGRKTSGVPRDRLWVVGPVLVLACAVVSALFAALLAVAGLPGVRHTAFVSSALAACALGLGLSPRYLLDGAEYVLTDRRILLRRGRWFRSMTLSSITYARVLWHPSVAGLGHLELVCAVPFGPLARKQRIVLQDVQRPDAVFSLIRGVPPNEYAGDPDVPVAERLDPGEQVLWGGHPEGWLLGWRDIIVAAAGVGVTVLGLSYGHRVASILVGLEDVGLRVRSWEWVLFFLAVAITWGVMLSVGGWLIWYGVWRARRLGRETEYLLTGQRVLIRRGRTELSIDRRRIVDIADTPAPRGLHNLFLVLDGPKSRALAVSGALGPITPSRDSVPPVLYELRDVERVKSLILKRDSRPSTPPLSDAA